MGAIDPVIARQQVKTKSASVESRLSPFQHIAPNIRCSAINLHYSSPEDDDEDDDEFFYYKKPTLFANNNFHSQPSSNKRLSLKSRARVTSVSTDPNRRTKSTDDRDDLSQDSLAQVQATALCGENNYPSACSSASPSAASRARNFLSVAMGGFSPLRPAVSASCLFTSPSSTNLNDCCTNSGNSHQGKHQHRKELDKSEIGNSVSAKSSNALASIPTRASLTHNWRKLKTPNKCRECNMFVYFNGRECSCCNFIAHKKCVISLVIKCSGGGTSLVDVEKKSASMLHVSLLTRHSRLNYKQRALVRPIYGQSLSSIECEHVLDFIRRFIYEIDTRGLTSKGIYRVSSIKSKVDRLCQCYDQNPTNLIDLSSFHPNIIANALKIYLRQLPEPLLTHKLYHEFINIAKKYPEDRAATKSSSTSFSLSSSFTAPSEPGDTNYGLNKSRQLKRSNAINDDQSQQRQMSTSNSLPSNTLSTKRPIQQEQNNQQTTTKTQTLAEMLQDLRIVLDYLPPINKKLVSILMRHLRRVADMSDENQMSAKNLGIIFGPTLLSLEDNKSLAIVDNIHQARLIELMITWAYELFPETVEDDDTTDNYIEPDYSSHVSY